MKRKLSCLLLIPTLGTALICSPALALRAHRQGCLIMLNARIALKTYLSASRLREVINSRRERKLMCPTSASGSGGYCRRRYRTHRGCAFGA